MIQRHFVEGWGELFSKEAIQNVAKAATDETGVKMRNTNTNCESSCFLAVMCK